MKKFKLITTTAFVVFSLTGCVSKSPTTSDFMRMHATDEKEMASDQKLIAKEWDRGATLKLSGAELIKEGENLIKSGNHDVTIGNQKIEQGNKDSIEGVAIMGESERMFHEKYPDLKLNLNK